MPYTIAARYSPIASIGLLEEMHNREQKDNQRILGNYLLLLTHDVLDHPSRYEELIICVREAYADTFIIMDNSLVELGHALPVGDVITAAVLVCADCIMTPDALGGFEATKTLVGEQKDALLDSDFALMRVPQGDNTTELVECVQWLRDTLPTNEAEFEYWGIPRWITNKIGSRVPISQFISSTTTSARIHLLGMSDNFMDDIQCTKLPDVMGIDSANPIVAGIVGWDMTKGETHHLSRGKDFWCPTELNDLSVSNVRFIHDIVKG